MAGLIGLAETIRLGMTGERIDTAEAVRLGLVQQAVDDLDAGLERARALAEMVARRSPTAVAAFKLAALAAYGRPPAERRELEARAYEHCLAHGEAAVGRAHFKSIRDGGTPPWGRLRVFEPDE